jgi:hypothetical protein
MAVGLQVFFHFYIFGIYHSFFARYLVDIELAIIAGAY